MTRAKGSFSDIEILILRTCILRASPPAAGPLLYGCLAHMNTYFPTSLPEALEVPWRSQKLDTYRSFAVRRRRKCYTYVVFRHRRAPEGAKIAYVWRLCGPVCAKTTYVCRFWAFGEPRETSGALPGALGGPGCAMAQERPGAAKTGPKTALRGPRK